MSTSPSPRPAPLLLPWLNVLVVLAIVALDWITPAGVVVGILLGVPIILTSMHDDPRVVWGTAAVAVIGFTLAAGLGRGPIAPDLVWVPNRVFAFLTLPASAYLARLLQQRRHEAEAARDEALGARDLNRLLMSLLAHDLRAPLALATQGLDYVLDATREARAVDAELIGELRGRLQRSQRAVEVVLTVARENRHGTGPGAGSVVPLSLVGPEIAAEVGSLEGEARSRGKTLVARLEGLEHSPADLHIDGLVLRQSLGILLDNAIRHAVAGEVCVDAAREGDALVIRVRDQGPGLSRSRDAAAHSGGAGLGLELARTLAVRVGGALVVEQDAPEGTRLALRLPLHAAHD